MKNRWCGIKLSTTFVFNILFYLERFLSHIGLKLRNAIRPIRLHVKSITYGNYTFSKYNHSCFTVILGFAHTGDMSILPQYTIQLTMLQQPTFNEFSLIRMYMYRNGFLMG